MCPQALGRNCGVFVTLSSYPSMLLRGCIGFPEPIFSLASALIQAAQYACHDPRFEDLREDELNSIVVEVSILTPPKEVLVSDPKLLPKTIKVGRDGLIASNGPYHGLLLPQVPVEYGWDEEEFLRQTCVKAGMTPDMWLDKDTKISSFQADVFTEEAPRGKAVRKELS